MVLVDRPRPVKDKYKEVEFMVHLGWVEGSNIPAYVRVEFEPSTGWPPIRVEPDEWESLDDAIVAGRVAAWDVIDRSNAG